MFMRKEQQGTEQVYKLIRDSTVLGTKQQLEASQSEIWEKLNQSDEKSYEQCHNNKIILYPGRMGYIDGDTIGNDYELVHASKLQYYLLYA